MKKFETKTGTSAIASEEKNAIRIGVTGLGYAGLPLAHTKEGKPEEKYAMPW